MEYTGEIIDLSYAARITAIFVAGNKMYTSNCDHQDCYEEFCEDNNIDSGLDWSGDFNVTQEKAIKITNSLFEDESEDIYGFDIFEYDFDKYYLTSHFPHNMEKCYEMMKKYAEEHNLILGTFFDRSYNVKLIK